MDFNEIPQFTRDGNYRINVSWGYLEQTLDGYKERDQRFGSAASLDLDPDFQRGHVWKEHQQTAFVEHVLSGGIGSKEIRFNCTGWMADFRGPFVIVDGKQRLEAARKFMRGELKAFGYYFHEFTGRLRSTTADFIFNINNLSTRKQVLKWYLEINTGGVVHTPDEIQKVRDLLAKEEV
jgi:hypothetical protein